MVSVIVPSYNCAQFLPFAIDSVLDQTLQDFELIVVDDGSTDRTPAVMQAYRWNPRIRYVRQANRGLPGARNRGVHEARGEFIAALDADDALAPSALAHMLEALETSDASWCVVDILKFWDQFQEVRQTQIPSSDLLVGILAEDFIRRGMFFRREALERVGLWDKAVRMREDWDLNIRLIAASERFVYLPEPLYLYRRRPGSITTSNLGKLLHYTELVLRKHHLTRALAGDKAAAKLYSAHTWDLARRYFYELHAPIPSFRCARESLAYDFDLTRIIHPLVHNLRSAYGPKPRPTT